MVGWLQITSGRGPAECCRAAARVVERIRRRKITMSLILRGPKLY